MNYKTTDELMSELSTHWDRRQNSNLYKLLDVYNTRMVKIAKKSKRIAKQRSIKKAKGGALNLMGKDRGLIRNTNDDNLFRFMVYIKTLLSKADGTFPKIAEITGTALNSNEEIRIIKTGVHHISVSLPLDMFKDSESQKLIIKNISQLTALGIWLDNFIFENENGEKIVIAASKVVHKSIITTATL